MWGDEAHILVAGQGVNILPLPLISRTCDRIAYSVRKPGRQFGVSPISPFIRRI